MQNRLCTLALFILLTLRLNAQELHFVKDVNLWTSGIEILDVATSENYFFFVATNPGDSSPELWRTDGTTTGTIMLQENIFKTDVLGLHYLSESYNNVVYYQAIEVEEGRRDLWRTDGTLEGTYLLTDLEDDELRPAGFTELNGALYFCGRMIDDTGENRRGLYKADGSAEGTVLISQLSTCSSDGNNNVEQAILFNDAIYWFYHTEECIYRSDGTQEGTGLYFGEEDIFDIKSIFQTDDRFYFVTTDVFFQTALYSSDGTSTGISKIQNTYKPLDLFAALDNKLIYTARDPDNINGNNLWVVNEEDQSAMLLYDFYTEEEGARIENLITFNNKVYFTASEYDEDNSNGTIAGTGTELWATDGTTAGTYLVKDINQGTSSSNPGNIVILEDKMYFLAKYDGQKYALFQSDGTTEGTIPFFDLPNEALTAAKPKDLYYHNNSFYLTMGDVFTGRELWRISLPVVNRVDESNIELSKPKIIPNPFRETAIIQFEQAIPHDIQIQFYNQNGQAANMTYTIDNKQVILTNSNLSNGFYFYQMLLDGQVLNRGKLVIQ